MIEVDSEEELKAELKTSAKVYALFYASWCPFCRSFLPVFEKYARRQSPGKFLRVRIDDEANSLWEKYDVQIVPTVILFKGEKVIRLDGGHGIGLSEEQLKNFIESTE